MQNSRKSSGLPSRVRAPFWFRSGLGLFQAQEAAFAQERKPHAGVLHRPCWVFQHQDYPHSRRYCACRTVWHSCPAPPSVFDSALCMCHELGIVCGELQLFWPRRYCVLHHRVVLLYIVLLCHCVSVLQRLVLGGAVGAVLFIFFFSASHPPLLPRTSPSLSCRCLFFLRRLGGTRRLPPPSSNGFPTRIPLCPARTALFPAASVCLAIDCLPQRRPLLLPSRLMCTSFHALA